MTPLNCAEVLDLAPELAVGNLGGEERAAALTHLASCSACQHVVSSMTNVTDALLLLGPSAEPPVGFEQRVFAAMSSESTPMRVRRRRHPRATHRWGAVVAVAAALMLALIAAGLLLDLGSSGDPAFASARMRTANGEVVGGVFVRATERTELFMTLPRWSEQIAQYDRHDASYAVRVTTSDGDITTHPVTLTSEASWATTLDLDRSVTSVSLIDDHGQVWCHAELEPPDDS